MLTSKQARLVRFIHEHLERDGVSPSYEEMRVSLELQSKSGIHRLVIALEERGFIRRLPNKARAIEVLRLPTSSARQAVPPKLVVSGADLRAFRPPGLIGEARSKKLATFDPAFSGDPTDLVGSGIFGSTKIPIMGKIAAGAPSTAIETILGFVDLPSDLIGSGEFFALEVKGDSMIDVGIFDGDMVIIRRGSAVVTGDIVVAMIDGSEATLKRIRLRKDAVALEAANPHFETRIFSASRVVVQGKLVRLLRRYD